MDRSNGNRCSRPGAAPASGHSQSLKATTTDYYVTSASAKQGFLGGTAALSPRKSVNDSQRLLWGSAAGPLSGSLPHVPKSPRAMPQSVCPILGTMGGPSDITCFLAAPTSKVRQMECLLMSPTRRTGKKPHAWHWDYGTNSATAAGDIKGASKVQVAATYGSEDAIDSPTAAAGSVRVGTPVALACGQLSDVDNAYV